MPLGLVELQEDSMIHIIEIAMATRDNATCTQFIAFTTEIRCGVILINQILKGDKAYDLQVRVEDRCDESPMLTPPV